MEILIIVLSNDSMFSGFIVIGRIEAGLNSKFTGSNLDNVITHDAGTVRFIGRSNNQNFKIIHIKYISHYSDFFACLSINCHSKRTFRLTQLLLLLFY